MDTEVLFSVGSHRNLLLPSYDEAQIAPTNQHLVMHEGAGLLLDPGGQKVHGRVLSQVTSQLEGGKLEYIFLSHQDPDVIAALNGWLMMTDAVAYASVLWIRFIPHLGLDRLVLDRLLPVADEGMTIDLKGCKLKILPAHFLHSCGNLHLYDPVSKILYSGDLGASTSSPERKVTDFDAHVLHMLEFHRRFMGSNAAMRAWARMARTLDIEIIAPQHGAYFAGKSMVARFIDWVEGLKCGIDLMEGIYKVPD